MQSDTNSLSLAVYVDVSGPSSAVTQQHSDGKYQTRVCNPEPTWPTLEDQEKKQHILQYWKEDLAKTEDPDKTRKFHRKAMSVRTTEGGCGLSSFLSAHRCPESDLLPEHNLAIQAASVHPKLPSCGRSDYLDVSSSRHSEDEGSDSDWSEEDLTLHFSPSVILPSDEENSDPEGSFECFDVSVESQVAGQRKEGLKMVPKRQIQLKKRKTEDLVLTNRNQESHKEKSDGELSVKSPRPEMQRQHSMPASFHSLLTTAGDSEGNSGYKGLVAGANQGLICGKSEARKLQKSVSLDETKTKMASCIIKSVLSKKMQDEQAPPSEPHSSTQAPRTTAKHCKPPVLPLVTQHCNQERVRDRGVVGGNTSCSGLKAPVHMVRDMRSLVKNTYSLSFRDKAPKSLRRTTSFKVIGQEASPPPSYQQAVGVKGQTLLLSGTPKEHLAKITAALSQSPKVSSKPSSQPITDLRRHDGEHIIGRKSDDITRARLLDLSPKIPEPSNSDQTQPSSSPPLLHSSTHNLVKKLQANTSMDQKPTQTAPVALQQIMHPCFFPAGSLPVFPTMNAHVGKVSYVQTPMSYTPTQLQQPSTAPALHLLQPDQNQGGQSGTTPSFNRTESIRAEPQQSLFHVVAAPTAAPTPLFGGPALFSNPTPYHMVLDPKSGQCFYVESTPRSQRKMLLDPETGQYIEVLLPAAKPAVLSMMQIPHPLAVYPQPCLPFTVHTAVNYTAGP